MPQITVQLPRPLAPPQRAALVQALLAAAANAEQIPDQPRHRAMCWIELLDTPAGALTCGGENPGLRLPCRVAVCLPSGVLDEASRARYVAHVDAALRAAYADTPGEVLSSVLLHEQPDGHWGVNGRLWTLAEFARAAGYRHLQLDQPAEVRPMK